MSMEHGSAVIKGHRVAILGVLPKWQRCQLWQWPQNDHHMALYNSKTVFHCHKCPIYLNDLYTAFLMLKAVYNKKIQ